MKIFKTLAVFVMSMGLMIGANSCSVHLFKHDSSNQRTGGGKWSQKNTNNPHHPNTTNPGHTKSKGKSKGPK
jgi:hypothetical protein